MNTIKEYNSCLIKIFAQFAQKNCENSFRFMRKNSQKNISGFAQIAQKI